MITVIYINLYAVYQISTHDFIFFMDTCCFPFKRKHIAFVLLALYQYYQSSLGKNISCLLRSDLFYVNRINTKICITSNQYLFLFEKNPATFILSNYLLFYFVFKTSVSKERYKYLLSS